MNWLTIELKSCCRGANTSQFERTPRANRICAYRRFGFQASEDVPAISGYIELSLNSPPSISSRGKVHDALISAERRYGLLVLKCGKPLGNFETTK